MIVTIGGAAPAHPDRHLPALHHGGGHHPLPARRRVCTDGTGFAAATLAELALVLAVISVAVSLIARLVITRTGRIGAPVGPVALPGRSATWIDNHVAGATYVALVLMTARRPGSCSVFIACGPRRPQWSVLWTTLMLTGGGSADQYDGTLTPVGVFIVAGSIGVWCRFTWPNLPAPVGQWRPAGAPCGPPPRAGFPSIVWATSGVALVVGLHLGFSLPAVIILSIMVIPYIAKTTENSLRQVPTGYRSGAEALGMSMGYGLRKVILEERTAGRHDWAPACHWLYACEHRSRASSTPPGSRPHCRTRCTHAQFPYLTYVVFQYYNAPEAQYHYLAYDAALSSW